MDKPKFKMSKEAMLAFNDACDEAARNCPQFLGGVIEDREILLGEITAKSLVRIWRGCNVLFSLGYAELLTEEAVDVFKAYEQYNVDVFKAYRQYRAEKRIWKKEKA